MHLKIISSLTQLLPFIMIFELTSIFECYISQKKKEKNIKIQKIYKHWPMKIYKIWKQLFNLSDKPDYMLHNENLGNSICFKRNNDNKNGNNKLSFIMIFMNHIIIIWFCKVYIYLSLYMYMYVCTICTYIYVCVLRIYDCIYIQFDR